MDGLVGSDERGGSTKKARARKSGKGGKKHKEMKKVSVAVVLEGDELERKVDAEALTRELVRSAIRWRVKLEKEIW